MTSRSIDKLSRRIPLAVFIAGALLVAPACDEDPVPAPDFVLTDANPASPTHGQERSVHEVTGRVLLLYFVSFG